MHLSALELRNYRVYRDLQLEFPDGLIGIYGPNGSGKSTLVESIRFALFGESRTNKDELRSAGPGARPARDPTDELEAAASAAEAELAAAQAAAEAAAEAERAAVAELAERRAQAEAAEAAVK